MIINEVYLLVIFRLMLMMMMFGKLLKNVVKLKVRILLRVRVIININLDVRLIRDSTTSVGKGFGYVLFQVNFVLNNL